MCVIIHRKPGITIPHDKLSSACKVNSDGMGIVIIDRGKMELRKYFDAAGNDPDILAKHLEDAKDQHVYVHLRYRTKGATDKENVHPFGVLKHKKHGVDLQFMHNGTLSDFGTEKSCDSKDFAKKMLTPLAERFLKSIEPTNLLHDEVFTAILDRFAGKGSVFLLVDNLGNHRIINYDNGKEFTGWWASNEYSFNRYHRDPVDYNYGRKSYGEYGYGKGWERDWPQTPVKKETTGGTAKPPFNDEVPFPPENKKETSAKEVKEVAKVPAVNPTIPRRMRFTEIAEIDSLSDVCQLSSEHIKDLIDEYPEEAYMLIRDLIKELYDRDMEMDDIADAIEDQKDAA